MWVPARPGWRSPPHTRTRTPTVVGIDVFDTALTLARANVEASGLTDRVELRVQDAGDARRTRFL